MVRHQRVDGAVLQRLAQGLAVALLAQRWAQARATVEVAHIHIRQVQRIDADIARHRQSLGLGLAQQLGPGGAAQAADMHPRSGGAYQLKNRVQSNGLSGHRHAAQAHARSQRAAGGDAFTQMQILRAQPNGVAKRAGVLHGAHQHLGVGDANFGLAKSYASGLKQLQHFGQHLALKATR